MDLLLGAIALGLAYALLAMGIFITMSIYNFPDITADGSLTLGGALTGALLAAGWNPFVAVGISTVGGAIAGTATGTIHTKLKVNGLLAGILVMTALYSVNLRIMGRSNIPLVSMPTIFAPVDALLSPSSDQIGAIALLLPLAFVALLILSWLFRTDFGLTMRATGDNATMIAAQGASVDRMKIVGIALANGLIAASGSIIAQYQGFADIGMGIGIVVFGLASVIIGDTLASLFGESFRITLRLGSVVVGSILFRLLVAFTLSLGLDPMDLKLATAAFVLLTIAVPKLKRRRMPPRPPLSPGIERSTPGDR